MRNKTQCYKVMFYAVDREANNKVTWNCTN